MLDRKGERAVDSNFQGAAGGRDQFVIHSPGMLQTFRASGINQNLKTSLLRKDFWQPV